MVFGKTYEEKRKEKEEKYNYDHWEEWFAWRPVGLKDGRIAWFEIVEYKYESTWGYDTKIRHVNYREKEKSKEVI